MSEIELAHEFAIRLSQAGRNARVHHEQHPWLLNGYCTLGVIALHGGKYNIGIRSGVLPSMCGGSSLYIAEASTANTKDICSLTWDMDECGFFTGSYYGTDCYGDEGYCVWGVPGQVIVQFSRDMSTGARAASLEYLRDQLQIVINSGEDMLDQCSVPECTTVKWLAKDTVGLFTEYTYEDTNCGYSVPYTPEKELDRVKSRGYEGIPSLHGSTGGRLAGNSGEVCTNYHSEYSYGKSPREILRESEVITPMLQSAASGDTVILTDNMRGWRSVVGTIDVIHWLAEYGPDVQAQVDSWLDIPGPKAKGFVTTLFPVAHNPNEGAHEITGCSLCSIENAPADDAPYEMEVWTYE